MWEVCENRYRSYTGGGFYIQTSPGSNDNQVSTCKLKYLNIVDTFAMNTKVNVLLAAIAIVIILVIWFFFMRKEKFVGDFSYDSGFYAVDTALGGSGILEDPINQSRTNYPSIVFK
ncbi:hypothetical protein ATCVCanal1_439R [Acanthocystis turfacea Chlorella virus Canal-1]|nr:hypothetical protein ATCVCanal1_439R [Acanthocystis turfacea Chlorella virus Canal-1]